MLNFAGVITAENIIMSWRMAVFFSAVVGAIATPDAEPMAMFLLMIPLLILYFLAAGIAYLNVKRVAKKLASLELADPQAAE
jgi:sec-independent protein translocase protein TatC